MTTNVFEKKNYNEITAFAIGQRIYRVIGTKHGMQRITERGLDGFHVASACLALGRKLDSYNDSGKNIMIVDKGKNISIVLAVENGHIVIITALDKSDPYAKKNTVIEDFNFKIA